ncbi:MAG: DUF4126 domain-containing protein [Chloroflexales bacterium]|nr:DUF4126 domain-containing protein [Chloroflexales bacterium]
MEALQVLRTILPLALTSGINLYLTILVVGLSIRLGWAPDAPAGLQFLAELPVLIGAGVLYVIEFFADKIAFIDNLWDLIHTVIRPIGAIVIATASLTSLDPTLVETTAGLTGASPETSVFAAVVAGVVALLSHGGKAGARTTVNVTSPTETFSNIAISLLEDLAVAVIAFLALRYPTAANVISIALLILIVVFVPQLLRWAWFTLKAVFAWLKSFVRPIRQSDHLPPAHAALLDDGLLAQLSVNCQAQNIKGASGRYGYLVLTGAVLLFTYEAWFRTRAWRLDPGQIQRIQLRRRLLVDVLEIEHGAGGAKSRLARFAFTRDRRPLIEQAMAHLGVAQPTV